MDITERNRIVEDNLKLVYKVAATFKKYNNYLDIEELKQVGSIGLINAVEKFDKSQNCKFSTFAYSYISGYIKNWLSKQTDIKIPRYKLIQITKLNICENTLNTQLGYEPTKENICKEMNISLKQYTELTSIRRRTNCSSIDDSINYNGQLLKLQIEDDNDEYENIINSMTINKVITVLNPNEKKFIKMRFFKNYSMQEIANNTGYTRQNVYQTIEKGLAKMKRKLISRFNE